MTSRKMFWRLAVFLMLMCLPTRGGALEPAPLITDREIVERLTRLEEGLKRGKNSLRAEIRASTEAITQLRQDMIAQFDRIDAQFNRIDAQFDRVINVMLGIMGAFVALVGITISLMLWDRRTMIRPFEEKTRQVEEDLSRNHRTLHSLLEALRALSHSDEKVAEVLKRFNLL